jgi:tetratricopeptide (TPR) repeat protein
MSEVPTTAEKPDGETTDQAANAQPRRRRALRSMGLLMLLLAGLLAWYLIVFYVGWSSGQTAQDEKRAADLLALHDRQLKLAQQDILQGSYALALLRLEWILQQTPEDSEALAMYQQALAAQEALLTPQATATATASPTPPPSPTATPIPIEDPDSELARIESLVESEAWEDAVPALVAFQRQFPNYRRAETDEMLYESYIGLGLQLVQGARVELGLSYLELAEKLGDLPETVADYRTWAKLYLQGIAFYSVNWGVTIFYFRDLCLAAPFYQSSCDRLYEALVAYGDQFSVASEWCPAQDLYAEALQLDRSQPLINKLNQARDACLLATPTPDVSDQSTPITTTLPFTAPFSILPPPRLSAPSP